MDNKVIEEYIEKIHKRWLNARDSKWETDAGTLITHYGTLETTYSQVENELRKMLKEDEELKKEGQMKMWMKSIGDVLVETAKEV